MLNQKVLFLLILQDSLFGMKTDGTTNTASRSSHSSSRYIFNSSTISSCNRRAMRLHLENQQQIRMLRAVALLQRGELLLSAFGAPTAAAMHPCAFPANGYLQLAQALLAAVAIESRRKFKGSISTVEQGQGQGQELLELLQVELEQLQYLVWVQRQRPAGCSSAVAARTMEHMVKAAFGVGDAGGAGGNMGWVRMVLPARDMVYALPPPASTPNQHKPSCTDQSTGQCGSRQLCK